MRKILLIVAFCLFAHTANLSFAQLSVDNPSEKKAFSQVGLDSPLIQKLSDKGIYNITLKSAQSSSLSGLNFEIVFLNASFKNPNSPLQGTKSNVTLDNPAAVGLTVPSVVEHVIPVKSFNIAILSNDGKELLKRMNEIPKGGRILENVNLNGFAGNITISLYDIIPDQSVTNIIKKQLESNESSIIDSAKIQSTVVKS
jgi:hypothetical protein